MSIRICFLNKNDVNSIYKCDISADTNSLMTQID